MWVKPRAEETVRKELDLEKQRRAASLETMSDIEKHLLARRIGVSPLEFERKFEELEPEERRELVEGVRGTELSAAEITKLTEEAQAARREAVEQAQAGLRAGGRLSLGTFGDLIRLIQQVGSRVEEARGLGMSIGEALRQTLTGGVFELSPAFAGQARLIDGFTRMRQRAEAEFEQIGQKAEAMFNRIEARTDGLFATEGRLGDLIFDAVYPRLVRQLEDELSRQ